ncbi:DoxX family protein [Staphylococcus gallinarum]|jgi:chorismate synthase|uniref:DoxX family protein n=1 Tax=Staphylococcus gallinarum TaxID=1293 RepID=A0A0D0SGL7_STAGA|nr:DoxX family protein [Staphylococcus gallinarum]KIR11465.1 membrane protein [Staphylococcus gallinarum]MBU7217048.1 DoxX family protein [Staphylococcus gallinarum]MCD8784987.1 DoxX family protein [Staphylococcus gallinarum]MCD8792735.1 DoxX family protein [Staphylococcus gallinarum]MCD8829892.1 DoxX family protein [Staphylococcus gallinarum]
MILRYLTNLKLAKELYGAAKPKLQGDQSMKDTFEEVFNLPSNAVPLAGAVEALSALFFVLSFGSKKLSRLGSLLAISVLGVAAFKHFEAGHGKAGAKHALDLTGLAALSLLDTVDCKKK